MERTRYIQWNVGSDDASLASNLLYEVRIAEDRYFSRILTDDASPGGGGMNSGIWSYDPLLDGNFIGIPQMTSIDAGTPIRYQFFGSNLTQHTIIGKGNSVYRVAWPGNRVIDSCSLQSNIQSLFVDQKTNNVWVTDSYGQVFVLSLPLATCIPSSVLVPSGALAVVPDMARNRFWVITSNSVSLISQSTGPVVSVSIPGSIGSVGRAYVGPNYGDLYFSSGNLLMHIMDSGISDYTTSYAVQDISPWTTKSVLFVARDNGIYQYFNGSVTRLGTGVGQGYSVHARYGDSIYIVNRLGNSLSKFDTNFNLHWILHGIPGSNARIWVDFDGGAPQRSIKYWSGNFTGRITDFLSHAVLNNSISLNSPGTAYGAVLNNYATEHVWANIRAITGTVVVYNQSSSSESSVSSYSSPPVEEYLPSSFMQSSSSSVIFDQTTSSSSSSSPTSNSSTSSSTEEQTTSSSSSQSISTSSSSTEFRTSSSSSSVVLLGAVEAKNGSLAAYWNLDSDMNDSVDSYNFTETGSISFVSAKMNNGIDFSGTTNYGTISSPPSVPTTGFAISCWITNAGDNMAQRNILAFNGTSGAEMSMYVETGTVQASLAVSSSQKVIVGTSDTLATGHWLAIASGGVFEIYYNGVLQQSASFGLIYPGGGTWTMAMGTPISGEAGAVTIDEVAFWKNITFTGSQRAEFVKGLYNGGKGRFYRSGNWITG